MSKAAAPQIELASADPSIAQEMTRWLSLSRRGAAAVAEDAGSL
ncbi:hypothetical protein ACVWWG_002829 [Bradyrhizobium sp. LB7.2]